MRPYHAERLTESVARLAAEFLERRRGQCLVTVTGARLDEGGAAAEILLTVYPETAGNKTLNEMKSLRGDLRGFLDARLRGSSLTRVDFALDERVR